MAIAVGGHNLSAQMLDTRTYSTTGHPTEALATPDGQYVLVTVDVENGPSHMSGIDVFRDTGKKLQHVAFQALGTDGAQGIVLVPHSQTLAVGVSNAGVAFLPLDDTLRGKAKVGVLPQGERSGSGYLAVTPDGQFLFVANEYGEGGNIGVIALHPDAAGTLHPQALAHIPTQRTTPGVALSPDGSRLFVESEVVLPEVAARLPGHGVADLERTGCAQGMGSPPMQNGALFSIDAKSAEALPANSSLKQAAEAVKAVVDAGCSPVRSAISPDGSTVYVTARGDNRILVFDAKLLESDPQHAFLRAFPSGGDAPVGVRVFNQGKALLVANSNRFAGGPGNAAVFDLSDPAKPVLRQTIRTGPFPRNITTSPDGSTLYLTIFSGDELMVLRMK
jgi:DNA-binding beta-propeller fold protein YncE